MGTLALVFLLGARHGLDADHLAAIDGFARLRPSRLTGVLFGLGHGLLVTLLALLAGRVGAAFTLDGLTPWLFLAVAGLNLWRLARPGRHTHAPAPGLLALGPFVVGLLLAAGMETSSQLAALALSQQVTPVLLGLTFTLGMVLSDGLDGLLAARVQRGAAQGSRAQRASAAMGWMVVALSLGFALAGFAGLDTGTLSGPLGAATFVTLLGLRLWSRAQPAGRPA
ncbi:nickel transporter (plasmid) [Deinococcus taeanensis]|uniref:HoxN/HupN/NixA family nickel/cobalt transporter n=1 Tax=Deinococcus taeanensis TaxID=2737050 RepID=UPI001CDCE8C4|nr:nickel transporter [Deinococcus taeanensis]UBV44870.1 nickel transporter [Deinococcus taeanensis]